MKTSAKHFGLAVGAQGQATWATMTPKLLYLWRQSQKIYTPNPQKFFRVQSARLAGLFESTRLADPKKLLWTYEEFN